MIPLAVVLIIIAFKDAMEDYRRYRYDKKINNTLTHVYSGSVCVRACLSGVVSVSVMCFFGLKKKEAKYRILAARLIQCTLSVLMIS